MARVYSCTSLEHPNAVLQELNQQRLKVSDRDECAPIPVLPCLYKFYLSYRDEDLANVRVIMSRAYIVNCKTAFSTEFGLKLRKQKLVFE